MRYGFIGLGNMGGAIVKGILSGDSFSDDEVYGYDVDSVKAEQLYEEAGVSLCGSVQDLAGHSDVIILAVKPQYMRMAEAEKNLREGKLGKKGAK